MTEKTKTLLAGGFMLAAQVVVAWAVRLSTLCMTHHWLEGLELGELPVSTDIALRYGQVIPIIAALLTVFIILVALRFGRTATCWLLSVALMEIIALSLFVVAIVLPSLCIMYRLAPSF